MVCRPSDSDVTRDETRVQGLAPEIVPSDFAENLSHLEFADDLQQYPVATATEKVGRYLYHADRSR
jgi:hypothetical protein